MRAGGADRSRRRPPVGAERAPVYGCVPQGGFAATADPDAIVGAAARTKKRRVFLPRTRRPSFPQRRSFND
jgi:hypothetical protein